MQIKSRKERYSTPPVFKAGTLVQPDMTSSFPCLQLVATSAISGFLFASFFSIPLGAIRTTIIAPMMSSTVLPPMTAPLLIAESVRFGFQVGGAYGTYLGCFRGINSANEHRLGRKNTKYTVTLSGAFSGAMSALIWSSRANRIRNVSLASVSIGALLFSGMTLAGIDEF
jgi:hypothetical protein